jgi:ABC-type multidrug transport system fused ATPase/permease subunit
MDRLVKVLNHILAAVILGLSLGILVWIFPMLMNDQLNSYIFNHEYRDSIDIAVQLGRLDFISILLAILAAAITIASLIGFGYMRWRADEIAVETATKVADKIARETVQKYIDNQGRKVIERSSNNPIDANDVSVVGAEKEVNGDEQ